MSANVGSVPRCSDWQDQIFKTVDAVQRANEPSAHRGTALRKNLKTDPVKIRVGFIVSPRRRLPLVASITLRELI
jgi:hypothetical protein